MIIKKNAHLNLNIFSFIHIFYISFRHMVIINSNVYCVRKINEQWGITFIDRVLSTVDV